MASSKADVSFFLLNSSYGNLTAAPASAVKDLPANAKTASATVPATATAVAGADTAQDARAVAMYWAEEAREAPLFTGIITSTFDATFNPDLATRHSCLLFLEVTVADPYDPTKRHDRVVVATFGNGHTKFVAGSYQEQFGKTLLLNTARANNLESIKKNIPGSRGKTIVEELHMMGSVYDFTPTLDVFDVAKIGARTKALNDKSAVGADHLRMRVELSLKDLHDTAEVLLKAFLSTAGRDPDLDDLEHLKVVDDVIERTTAVNAMFSDIKAAASPDLGVGPKPNLQGAERLMFKFTYTGGGKGTPLEVTDTWDAPTFLTLVRGLSRPDEFDNAAIVIEEQDPVSKKWKQKGAKKLWEHLSYVSPTFPSDATYPVPYRYMIGEGKVLKCPAEMHERLANRLSSISFKTTAKLPAFENANDRDTAGKLSEGVYNARAGLAKSFPCLDRKLLCNVVPRTRVEFCDLWDNGRMYCIKRGIDSDSVNKVCQQAADAALTLEQYTDAWTQMQTLGGLVYGHDPQKNRDKFTFVIGLIEDASKHGPQHLNLKGKLAISRVRGEIQQRGYGFEVEFIPIS